jgi:predicted nuclease of predicted toxin-antitoxin system
VKVFLDECVDWRLAREIAGHDVRSARDMQWRGMRNGELLARASREFDVFVTVDRNLSMQQNVSALPLAVIVLRARTNRLADLKPLIPGLMRALGAISPGSATSVGEVG